MIQVTKDNFDTIRDAYIAQVVDGMDMQSIVQLAYEALHINMKGYTVSDLEEEVNIHYDDLTELGIE